MEKKTINNAEIAFRAISEAVDAQHILIDLSDSLEAVFGEESPLCKAVDEAMHLLSGASNALYNLGYSKHSLEADDPAPFVEWVRSTDEYGFCEDCAHRIAQDDTIFTRCALSQGNAQYSPDCGCYRFKANDNNSTNDNDNGKA